MKGMTMRIIIKLAAAVLALLLGTAAVPMSTAAAAPACDAKFVDMSSSIHAPDVWSAIHNAEQETGADIYVRVFKDTPTGSAAGWWRQAVAECPAWQAPDGVHPSPNIIVIEAGLADRTSAIAYGDNWKKLDRNIDSIRAKKLNAYLLTGDTKRAITATLDAIVK